MTDQEIMFIIKQRKAFPSRFEDLEKELTKLGASLQDLKKASFDFICSDPKAYPNCWYVCPTDKDDITYSGGSYWRDRSSLSAKELRRNIEEARYYDLLAMPMSNFFLDAQYEYNGMEYGTGGYCYYQPPELIDELISLKEVKVTDYTKSPTVTVVVPVTKLRIKGMIGRIDSIEGFLDKHT